MNRLIVALENFNNELEKYRVVLRVSLCYVSDTYSWKNYLTDTVARFAG